MSDYTKGIWTVETSMDYFGTYGILEAMKAEPARALSEMV